MFQDVERRARGIDAKRRAGLLSDQEYMAAKLDLYYPRRSRMFRYYAVAVLLAFLIILLT